MTHSHRLHMENEHFLETADFRIHYVCKGKGVPLILVHGGGNYLYTFRHNIDALSQWFTVYALDIPGHGYSRVLAGSPFAYDFDLVCDAVNQFMDRLGIEQAHFAGHSWGGGWLIVFAHRFGGRVKKLVLIDSSGIRHRERLAWELFKYPLIGEVAAALISPGRVRKGLADCFYNRRLATPKLAADVYAPFTHRENRMAQVRFSRNLNWHTTEKALSRLQVPSLVLWGKQDRYIPVQHGIQMSKMIAKARLEIIDQCGHCPHEEHPSTANRVIAEFLLARQVYK